MTLIFWFSDADHHFSMLESVRPASAWVCYSALSSLSTRDRCPEGWSDMPRPWGRLCGAVKKHVFRFLQSWRVSICFYDSLCFTFSNLLDFKGFWETLKPFWVSFRWLSWTAPFFMEQLLIFTDVFLFALIPTMWGYVRPPRYLSWFITPITMIYGTYNYSFWGL
jgi:hypothetical protein